MPPLCPVPPNTEGIQPDASQLGPPMPYQRYGGMDRQDLSPNLAYIRSLRQAGNDTD